MAEAFLNEMANDRFAGESAGIEPGKLNPIVVQAMQELGIDLSGRAAKSVDSVIARGQYFDYVITVCDETSAERCPVFPGPGQRLHWSYPYPSGFTGTDDEKLAATREVRDQIRDRIYTW